MTMKNGRFEPLTADEMIELLMSNARAMFGEDMNDDEEAVIRTFYWPVAVLLADFQLDLREVLDAAQLAHSTGRGLDLLTALIGVRRRQAEFATGEVTFKRDTAAPVDYTIPRGTLVQTDSVSPIRFVTREKAILLAGETAVSGVQIQAVSEGVNGNVGAKTITVLADTPAGIESVSNPLKTDGGKEEENDADLRARAEDELSDGMRGTATGVRNELLKMKTVKSVSMFINDKPSTDGDGLLSHHFEAVVEGDDDQEVAQTIFDTKGVADGTQGGIHGTEVTLDAEIGNGQTHPVSFSRPVLVPVYFEISLDATDLYAGDSKVKDAIVRYLGGTLTSGDFDDGDLRVGDDVTYTKVLASILSVEGIDDVPILRMGRTSTPTTESNLSIGFSELATGDATDASIQITTDGNFAPQLSATVALGSLSTTLNAVTISEI